MERFLLLCVYFATFLYISYGCSMEGVTQWLTPQHVSIKDTHRGLMVNRGTEDIEDINRIDYGDGLNRGPYLEILLQNSVFSVSTTDLFAQYEEYETLLSIRVTITFRCTGGSTRPLTFVFNIDDTNNHAPVFLPSDNFNFPLALPVPPGFNVTGCEYLIVRDVDLTTKRIEFWIEDNPYFEILYSRQTQPKEFGGFIRTRSVIRSTPDSLLYRISATDVDDTNDEPLTSFATVNILADNEFRLPDEPIFSEAFYKADYTEDHELVLRSDIRLRQGYDNQVKFSHEGVYAENFELVENGNQVSFRLISPLPSDITDPQIFLVVRVEREFTSGSKATVVVFLPEVLDIKFESSLYEGHIEDNVLRAPNLILTQGYENIVDIGIISEHASYFSVSRRENTITLSMRPLPISVIQSNNILSLQVVASANRSSDASVVALEIIKDDYITPVFEYNVYNGNYDSETGLTIDPIMITQGFDSTVVVTLGGEYASYFRKVQQGAVINLSASIPPELWSIGSLLITVVASKPRTVGANAAVQVNLPEARELIFEEPSYTGSIENNILTLQDIVLIYGYANDVRFELSGQFSSYFNVTSSQNRVAINLRSNLPDNIILENSLLMLILTASGLNAVTATTHILLDIIKNDYITPVFERPLYNGNYDSGSGLVLEHIIIVQGFDNTVELLLDGDHANLFEIKQEGEIINLTGSVPPNIWPEQYLFLTMQATKPRTVGANTAIQISLPAAREMKFYASEYIGYIANNTLSVEEIVLSVGYNTDVEFDIIGEFARHFTILKRENRVSINLNGPLPENIILENDFILLTVSAFGLNAISTATTVLLEILKEDTNTPIFSQNIYQGFYKDSLNVDIEEISLIQGYDSSVSFRLQGDHSQYFEIRSNNNDVKILIRTPIPEELIFNEKVLLFKVVAEKERTVGAIATVSIEFPRELTEPTIMKFSQNIYLGSIKDEILEVDTIILDSGFRNGTSFILSGDFAELFELSISNNIVTVGIKNSISIEEMIKNKFILLVIQAYRDRAVSVSTSVVIDVMTPEPIIFPVFEKSFYNGSYTNDYGLQFDHEISLIAGFDDTVTFGLEGEYSKWFALQENGNSVSIILNASQNIPNDVIESNYHLLFTIVANKPGTFGGRSAISIVLPKEQTEQVVLRFEQNNYVGHIEDRILHLVPLSLNKDTENIQVHVIGEHAAYFSIVKNFTQITIQLRGDLDVGTIDKSFIILTIEASSTGALSGFTTVVLEITNTDNNIKIPIFEQAYYMGEYTKAGGLSFNHTIRLKQGFDNSISFTLEGSDSQGFMLKQEFPNYVLLLLTGEGLPQNNERSFLTFSIVANKPNSISGRSAIVIHLSDLLTAGSLRFTNDIYKGTIEKDVLSLDEITLEAGYSKDVEFYLTGDYIEYFQLSNIDGNITLDLEKSLPSDMYEDYNFLIFVLEARIENIRTHTTIILEIKSEPRGHETALIFEDTYYTGTYSETNGLVFNSVMSLINGFDDQVQFSLQGDYSIWFGLQRQDENSVTLILTNPIPPAILANNRKLIFVVTAERPNSIAARATIVISLTDEYTSDTVLGFERASYSGSLSNDTLNLEPIILTEGFSPQVSFTLQGDLASHFTLTMDGQTVRINLLTAIPEDSIPTNRIILLELRASAPQSIPAFATIVVAVESENNVPSIEQPSFVETYYTGRYTEQDGLTFEHLFSLSQGYDENVVFSLEGENSVWFGLEQRSENLLALILRSPIPPAVLANNQKLIFIISASRPGSMIARATVIIALTDEYISDNILGFERISYSGSLNNNTLNLEPIILTEGFSPQVSFTLQGDLASHFTLTMDGQTVRINLLTAIPEDSIPTNRIILLELRASAPQAIPAFATIVVAVESENNVPSIEQPSFVETYYTGRYTEQDGLTFEHLFSLSQGYDENVVFSLEGENSVWFGLERRSENLLALILRSPIPPAVLANNQKLIFIISASRPGSMIARATVIIALTDEYISDNILGFERISYSGSLNNNTLNLEPIILTEGFSPQVSFTLQGDLASHFTLTMDGQTVRINLLTAIPEDSIPTNRIILLELRASAPQAIPAFATIVVAVESENNVPSIEQPSFVETYYTGRYTEQDGLTFEHLFSLSQGYDENVVFSLEGENSVWFGLERRSENLLALILRSPIPPAVLANNQKLIFIISASRPGSMIARATVIIALTDEYIYDTILGFERISYSGSLNNDTLNLEPIILTEGFSPQVSFTLQGDLASHFTLTMDGQTVRINLLTAIPEDSIPTNRIILLELRASAPQSIPAFATIVVAVETVHNLPPIEQPSFVETYYTGRYTEQDGLTFEHQFSLSQGYDENVVFSLEGDTSVWFGLERLSENSLALILRSPIPPAVLANNQKLIFIISASRPGSMIARATVIVALTDEYSSDTILGFERISYSGSLSNNTLNLEPIILTEGYSPQVLFSLQGVFASYFIFATDGRIVRIILLTAIPEDDLPTNRIILLELRASAPQAVPAFTTIVLAVESNNIVPPAEQLSFAEAYYTGRYTEQYGLIFEGLFSVSRGYDENVVFALEGDHSMWFELERRSENSLALTLNSPIPPAVLENNRKLIFVITASRPGSVTAQATVIVALTNDSHNINEAFDNILYHGFISLDTVTHEPITLTGYNGSNIEIFGQYAEIFEAILSEQDVVVNAGPSAIVPNVSYIALELQAGEARAVLVLKVFDTESPELPTVTFDSSSYVLKVAETHTGVVGRVRATSDNGEAITYSLVIDDENLRARLSVSGDGELRLSAPVTKGEHSLQVVATTIITRVTANALIYLAVEAVIDDKGIVVPPLIILDKDEEEPHRNLVVLNQTTYQGCHFILSNIWPENQTWLYVDEYGLHTEAIDREHESIAFMTLSQIQVELILSCANDNSKIRAKRSVSSKPKVDWLGPYEYGSNKWILTDSIPFNTRRSLVNLIVNDINDNAPIFVDKENEPIAVGYPVSNLEEIILPRSLAELKATDADIGENAALVYWSEEESIAVSPTTGFVHVRNHITLENNTRLIIQATDQKGAGLTGNLELVVKLLEKDHIAVITIRNAFLDSEKQILTDLSSAVGYEIKTLRTIVISESESSRKNRETSEASGVSLQLFVYGLIEREPVEVNKLTTDIQNSNIVTVNVVGSVSLEDHLAGNETCVIPGRDTGLLVATIVLSVLLFILIVVIAAWFLKRKFRKSYESFSDENSLASRNESLEPKPEIVAKPRLNIEDLKRSEKRLQERLHVPIVNVSVEPSTSDEKLQEAIINISTPEPNLPIVIQTIDKLKDNTEESEDDDEFGEGKRSKRKSVVTFNENVEKIIHLEDSSDNNPDSDYEIYRL